MHPKSPLLARYSIKYHQELVNWIIDDLRDSIPTLKFCSLVSKSWQPRAQKWLFEVVVFNAPPLYLDCSAAVSGEFPKHVPEVRRSNPPSQGNTQESSGLSNTRGTCGSSPRSSVFSPPTSRHSVRSQPCRYTPFPSPSLPRPT